MGKPGAGTGLGDEMGLTNGFTPKFNEANPNLEPYRINRCFEDNRANRLPSMKERWVQKGAQFVF